MMSKEFLKKIGILGVAFGLMASPLAFADMHEEEYEPQDPAPQEEPAPDQGGDDTLEPGADVDATTDEDPEHGGVGSDEHAHGTESVPEFEEESE